MPKEVPLQFDLFSGELVDNRTAKQKRLDREQEKPQQSLMFSQREMAQFRVPSIFVRKYTLRDGS